MYRVNTRQTVFPLPVLCYKGENDFVACGCLSPCIASIHGVPFFNGRCGIPNVWCEWCFAQEQGTCSYVNCSRRVAEVSTCVKCGVGAYHHLCAFTSPFWDKEDVAPVHCETCLIKNVVNRRLVVGDEAYAWALEAAKERGFLDDPKLCRQPGDACVGTRDAPPSDFHTKPVIPKQKRQKGDPGRSASASGGQAPVPLVSSCASAPTTGAAATAEHTALLSATNTGASEDWSAEVQGTLCGILNPPLLHNRGTHFELWFVCVQGQRCPPH